MITKKRYAIRNGVRPVKRNSLFGGGGLFVDQERIAQRELEQQQSAFIVEDESIPDPAIEAVAGEDQIDDPILTPEEKKALKNKEALAAAGKGTKIGASIGSIVPGVGTLIGGAVGGLIGGASSYAGIGFAENGGRITKKFGGRVRVVKRK